jgi:hypothetical protein
MTVPTGDFTSDAVSDIFPIDVRVVEAKGGGALAPDFGACSNVTVQLATTNVPTQIVQRRPTRQQAWIRNMDAANSVVIAERSDKLQQTPPVGFIIGPGQEEKICSQQPYWAVALVAPVVLSVRDEAWADSKGGKADKDDYSSHAN